MKKVTYEAPAMYGDHHVIEVRNVLLELAGIEDVYASSSFQAIEVTYDPQKISEAEITASLETAGYLGPWTVDTEPGAAIVKGNGDGRYFRHTAVHESLKEVSFARPAPQIGRPLWPCPGLGVIKAAEEEN